ncbi:MAG: hypothetical protein H7Y59_04510 [Anaerolineales bacterium]|nr:hypothetical protein [Anaerolineales bacterium]
MNMYPSFTNKRSLASSNFYTLRMQALRDLLWSKLTGRNSKLATFPRHTERGHANRKLIGVKDIHIDHIIGTLNRDSDFDDNFRPLGKHLFERWVNIFANLDPDSWEPILVHKIGEQYYVEDGHHRVSVARSLGMLFIQAKVWEYSVEQKKIRGCKPIRCAENSSAKVPQRAAG